MRDHRAPFLGQMRQRETWGALVSAAVILLAVFLLFSPGGDADLLFGSASDAPEVGAPAPPFQVLLTSGDIFDLEQATGRPIWINVWASWCPPCRAEMPDIDAVQRSAAAKGLIFLAVNDRESPDVVDDYVRRTGYQFNVAYDVDAAFARTYRVLGLPTHIFIGADGTIKSIRVGSLTRTEMIEITDALLADRQIVDPADAPDDPDSLSGSGDIRLGQALYNAQCLACHGGPEGAPGFPGAPPHTSDGHTWHHSDSDLTSVILKGTERMPGFQDRLSEDQIVAILEYLKTWWTSEEREFQQAAGAFLP